MKLSELQQLFASDVVKLLQYMEKNNHKFSFGEAYRTPEQAALYEQQGKGIKNSLHCKKLAIDINLFDEKGTFLTESKDHELFGKYWESLSPMNRWGGNFKTKQGKPFADANHYERNEFQS